MTPPLAKHCECPFSVLQVHVCVYVYVSQQNKHRGRAYHSRIHHSTAEYATAQHSFTHSTAQLHTEHSTAQLHTEHSTAQQSTAPHTAQQSTDPHTAQHSSSHSTAPHTASHTARHTFIVKRVLVFQSSLLQQLCLLCKSACLGQKSINKNTIQKHGRGGSHRRRQEMRG